MTKDSRINIGERRVSSIVVLGKLDSHMQKNETVPQSDPIHKN